MFQHNTHFIHFNQFAIRFDVAEYDAKIRSNELSPRPKHSNPTFNLAAPYRSETPPRCMRVTAMIDRKTQEKLDAKTPFRITLKVAPLYAFDNGKKR
jgi:hypothetical protein